MKTESPAIPTPPVNRKRWVLIGSGLAVILLIAGIYYWAVGRNYLSTDDAFIDGHIIPINSKVAGQVVRLNVSDNQSVTKGDLLVEIDPQDYRIHLAQAEAELQAARAQARQASGDAQRSKQLFAKDQISRQVNDHAIAAADIALANAQLAEKKVQESRLDLENAQITAPESGRIGRKNVEIKSFLQVGQPLMAVVTSDVWVTANFKEIQLARMRPGQRVEIKVDAFPGHKLRGHVDSFQPGTGSRFSLFPPENATGNYVKVVQRIPVKIVIDEPVEELSRLSPGMSAVPVVDLH